MKLFGTPLSVIKLKLNCWTITLSSQGYFKALNNEMEIRFCFQYRMECISVVSDGTACLGKTVINLKKIGSY